jgi:hypothetical protein
MASTYVNDLRLNEMATGDASGSWGTVTNTNLELIGEAFSYGTETIGDADSTLTIADGAADAARSFYLKITSSVDLTTTRIVTLAPNTVSKVWMIENATTGSQVITIKQGSGATINVANGQVKMISTDGAGSGGAVLDLLVDVDLTGTTTLVNLDVSGTALVTGVLTTTAATVSNGGGQFNGAINVGVDDTGYDVKFFGATAGAYMLWDESADDLILGGAAGLSVNSAATVGGTLGVTGVVTANAGVVVDNFTLDGTTLALSSGNMSLTAANIILDSSGDIVLDGDGADVLFKDGGTEYLRITNSSSDVIYKNMTGDKDLIFKGIDGSTEITALTLDMSEAGTATFNKDILLGDDSAIRLGASQDLALFHDATNSTIRNNTGDLILDVAGDIILDADDEGKIQLQDNGVSYGRLDNNGGTGFDIVSTISDGDVRIRGNDGGATINALTLDMSAAGAATFNNKVTAIQYNISSVGNDDRQVGVDGSGFFVYNTADSRYDLQINDVGAVSIGGVVTANAGVVVDNITIDGQEIDVSSGDLTLDVAGDIILDAGGSDILLNVSGTTFGSLRENSSNFRIKSDVSDKDILFLGNDGGVEITALTLDMSAAGNATFNGTVLVSNGTPSLPSLSFSSDPNTGLYNSSADNIGFAIGGVDRAFMSANQFNMTGNGVFSGSISKGSGSFKIDHPLPEKAETHHLVHSFIEGPQADNIYRGKVALVDGSATVNIDDVAGMTDGTFAVLNREVQCFTSNETGWTAVRGSVSGNILTIEAQDASCTDTISWMVIGERQDKHMYDTEWTDENGKVIVEPLKEK